MEKSKHACCTGSVGETLGLRDSRLVSLGLRDVSNGG